MEKQPEVWLRGPLPDIHPLLQPVAHALLQAVEHVQEYTRDFPDELLWVKPAGTASAGFHLQHLRGVPERLFSYAMGGKLSESQLADLRKEGIPDESLSTRALADAFARQVG